MFMALISTCKIQAKDCEMDSEMFLVRFHGLLFGWG